MSNQTAAAKKAYIVSDGEERTEIVYATSGVAARRMGAREMHLEFSEVDSCYRSKELDQFVATGGPSEKYMIEQMGWWCECGTCNEQVTSQWTEGLCYNKFEEPFCSPECLAKYLALHPKHA